MLPIFKQISDSPHPNETFDLQKAVDTEDIWKNDSFILKSSFKN